MRTHQGPLLMGLLAVLATGCDQATKFQALQASSAPSSTRDPPASSKWFLACRSFNTGAAFDLLRDTSPALPRA